MFNQSPVPQGYNFNYRSSQIIGLKGIQDEVESLFTPALVFEVWFKKQKN